jgi:hypothetical protein
MAAYVCEKYFMGGPLFMLRFLVDGRHFLGYQTDDIVSDSCKHVRVLSGPLEAQAIFDQHSPPAELGLVGEPLADPDGQPCALAVDNYVILCRPTTPAELRSSLLLPPRFTSDLKRFDNFLVHLKKTLATKQRGGLSTVACNDPVALAEEHSRVAEDAVNARLVGRPAMLCDSMKRFVDGWNPRHNPLISDFASVTPHDHPIRVGDPAGHSCSFEVSLLAGLASGRTTFVCLLDDKAVHVTRHSGGDASKWERGASISPLQRYSMGGKCFSVLVLSE